MRDPSASPDTKPVAAPTLISIILPVHNQEDHVERVVEDYLEALSGLPCPSELVLVANACRDRSPAICRNLADLKPRIAVVELEQGGWGRAVRAGLRAARGELLCYTNLARTRGCDLAGLLRRALADPATVFKAQRTMRQGPTRCLGSLLFNLECRLLFSLPLADINGTPKIFPRAYDRLVNLRRNDDLIDLEFCLACQRGRYPLQAISLESNRRFGGRSTTGWKSAWRIYRGALTMWWQDRNTRHA